MYSLCGQTWDARAQAQLCSGYEGRTAPGERPCSRGSSTLGRAVPQLAGEGTQGSPCILPATVCMSVLHWTPVIRVPVGIEHCMGVGWGWPRTQEVPSGGLWASPELASALGGKDILRSLRNLHSPLLLLPPLTPSFKGEERWRGWGGGGEAAESALCCLPELWRAEQAMALDSQPPPLARLTQLHPFPSVLPPCGPVPFSEWAGHRGGRGQAGGWSVIWLLLPGPGP